MSWDKFYGIVNKSDPMWSYAALSVAVMVIVLSISLGSCAASEAPADGSDPEGWMSAGSSINYKVIKPSKRYPTVECVIVKYYNHGVGVNCYP